MICFEVPRVSTVGLFDHLLWIKSGKLGDVSPILLFFLNERDLKKN